MTALRSDFIRRIRYAVALGIPGISALGALAFLPMGVQRAVHAAASAPVEVVIVDGSGAPLTDPLAAVTTNPPAPTAAKLDDYRFGPTRRPFVLRPRTNFKQYRKPRGLSSAARRRQNTTRKRRK